MRKPTIHLNGSSAQSLFDGYRNALDKVTEAIEALQACAPHGRDYYVQDGPAAIPGIGATNEAINEHRLRFEMLNAVRRDLEKLALHVMEQGGDKVRS